MWEQGREHIIIIVNSRQTEGKWRKDREATKCQFIPVDSCVSDAAIRCSECVLGAVVNIVVIDLIVARC